MMARFARTGWPRARSKRHGTADGGGEAKALGAGWAPAYSGDGRFLLFADYDKESLWDIFYLDTKGDGKPVPLVKQAGDQSWPRLSRDGHYFVYISDESGQDEVYIKRFPSAEGKWQVSVGGGTWPRWSRRGNRLYYVRGDTLMEVDAATTPDLHLGPPKALFTRKSLGRILIFGWPPGFDVSPQDDRFVFCQPIDEKVDLSGIVVLENWPREFVRPGE